MSIAYADNCITENPKNITNLIDYIYSKNIDTVKILRPHAILWIDVDIANIRERIESLGESHKDIYESDSYLRYSRKGYEYSAHFLKDHGFDVYQINGNLSQGAVTQAILDIIIPMLESKGED
jgi:thymidylate kinase